MKTKALISLAVTAKLICVFIFAYAKIGFSHEAAHLNLVMIKPALCIFEQGQRGDSVVECWTLKREVPASNPTTAV